MIRVTVELHNANTGGVETLGVMDICNDGTSETIRRGNYKGRLYRRGSGTDIVQKVGAVMGFPRESFSVWRLVIRMLRDMFPEEKA